MLLQLDPTDAEARTTRATAPRALGQRTACGNPREWCVTEASELEERLLGEGQPMTLDVIRACAGGRFLSSFGTIVVFHQRIQLRQDMGARQMRARVLSGLAIVLVLASGCTTTGSDSGDPDTRRRAIDANVDDALARLFKQVEGSEQLVGLAKGVLVFPAVMKAGFVVGASRGQGALRVDGKTVSYHGTTSGSFGLQAGAQSTAVFLLFMTDDALRQFQDSSGWTVGADASVTLISRGASAQVTTATAQQPVIGYVLSNRGLMARISLDGERVTRLDL